jgi:hypothetical protein
MEPRYWPQRSDFRNHLMSRERQIIRETVADQTTKSPVELCSTNCCNESKSVEMEWRSSQILREWYKLWSHDSFVRYAGSPFTASRFTWVYNLDHERFYCTLYDLEGHLETKLPHSRFSAIHERHFVVIAWLRHICLALYASLRASFSSLVFDAYLNHDGRLSDAHPHLTFLRGVFGKAITCWRWLERVEGILLTKITESVSSPPSSGPTHPRG